MVLGSVLVVYTDKYGLVYSLKPVFEEKICCYGVMPEQSSADVARPLRHAHVVEGVLLPEVGSLPADPPVKRATRKT